MSREEKRRPFGEGRRAENGGPMKVFAVQDYIKALKGAGPQITYNIVERARMDPNLDWEDRKKIVDAAYPEPY